MSDGVQVIVDPDCPPGVMYGLPAAYVYGRINITGQIAEPAGVMWTLGDPAESHYAAWQREDALDRIHGFGSRHRPARTSYNAILRADRIRTQNRENIAKLGRPAGPMRRAT